MNLHRFKKGYTGANPERGLRDLVGAQKAGKRIGGPTAVRVKGRYISDGNDRIGQLFGMMGYIHAWLTVLLFPCSMFAADDHIFSPISTFIIGFAVVHGCAMFADGLRNSDAPWARRGIKIFWISTLVFLLGSVAFSLITA